MSMATTATATADQTAAAAAPAVAVRPGLAHGEVRHRRHLPQPHQLSYPQHMALLDVDRLPPLLQRSGFWSRLRRAGLGFRRADYMPGPAQHPEQPLGSVLRDRVQRETGVRPDGSIVLLGHLRQWGYCFNPVCFYFCHHQGRLAAIVAEITNTPWGERHAYVLDLNQAEPAAAGHRFRFRKAFHVSPYMPMDIDYCWTFTVRDQHIAILMQLYREQQCVFDAAYGLRIEPLEEKRLRQLAWRHPLQCQRVWWGIYWHALRLKLKKIRFHPHPDRT
ncbi:MAG: DUF1365 domain-containing protein [Gammaproteobacteria bacterium]|nr:DUF1365 domain-containing protein [Gammaproteobacteria bacterium]